MSVPPLTLWTMPSSSNAYPNPSALLIQPSVGSALFSLTALSLSSSGPHALPGLLFHMGCLKVPSWHHSSTFSIPPTFQTYSLSKGSRLISTPTTPKPLLMVQPAQLLHWSRGSLRPPRCWTFGCLLTVSALIQTKLNSSGLAVEPN